MLRIFVPPAQPVQRDRPPKGPDWLHEVKFDGYRAQLHVRERPIIYSKNGKDFSSRFLNITAVLAGLPCKSAIIDAEIVACNKEGVPDFRALYSGNYTQDMLFAWCFDLLELNGTDLRPLPLIVRKLKLQTLLRKYDHACLQYSDSFDNPDGLLRECTKRGLEGIVSKKKNAPYRVKGCDWIKVKCAQWKEANADRGELFRVK